jgi:hypothetical protein
VTTQYTQLSIAVLLAKLAERKISLPSFQRRLVWNSEKRANLIRSIRREWPVPALMMAANGPQSVASENSESLQLIDGLQRMHTIKHFVSNLSDYIDHGDIEDICQAEVIQLVRNLSEDENFRSNFNDCQINSEDLTSEAEKEIQRILQKWLRECTSEADESPGQPSLNSAHADAVKSQLSMTKLSRLLREECRLHDIDSITNISERITRKLERSFDISSKTLNIIIYSGPTEDLPDIFTALNIGGQKLTKFELFASQWATRPALVSDASQEFKAVIKESYEAQIDAGFEVEDIEDEEGEPSLHDYLFALSKIICDQYPTLFGKPSERNELNEMGFNLAATAYGLGIHETSMRLLNQRIRYFSPTNASQNVEYDEDKEIMVSLEKFYSALTTSCNEVLSILNPFLSITFAHARKTESLHNNSQIISIVCRFMNCIFDYTRNFSVKKGHEKDLQILKINILSHYLIESLDGTWKGAAAGKLWERVWSGTSPTGSGALADVQPSNFYLAKKTRDRIRKELDLYFEKDIESVRQARKVSQSAKVFLKFMMISNGMTVSQLNANNQGGPVKLEIEHLYPVARLTKMGAELGVRLPINNIGNLAPLPRKLNRAKTDFTISEYLASPQTKNSDLSIVRECLNLLSLEGDTEQEKAASVNIPSEDCQDDVREFVNAGYTEWCRGRFARMRDAIIDKIYTNQP